MIILDTSLLNAPSSIKFESNTMNQLEITRSITDISQNSKLSLFKMSAAKSLMSMLSGSVDLIQKVATMKIATLPKPPNTAITKIKIKRNNKIVVDNTVGKAGSDGDFKAEWVHHTKNKDPDNVILYLHGGAYVLASRRTHRPITGYLAKYANARVLGKLFF